MTCYLCAPEGHPLVTDPDALDAWNEACGECDARYWSDPVFILVSHDEPSTSASPQTLNNHQTPKGPNNE